MSNLKNSQLTVTFQNANQASTAVALRQEMTYIGKTLILGADNATLSTGDTVIMLGGLKPNDDGTRRYSVAPATDTPTYDPNNDTDVYPRSLYIDQEDLEIKPTPSSSTQTPDDEAHCASASPQAL